MTCREKLMKEYPEKAGQILGAGGINACPGHYGYMNTPEWCDYNPRSCTGGARCAECWDREIPEDSTMSMAGPIESLQQVATSAKFAGNSFDNLADSAQKALKSVKYPDLNIDIGCVIKDSGDRTEFETGAVRDMRSGKGRCDLMPLEVLARMFDRHDGKNGVFDFLVHFKNTNQTHFLVKALDRFALDTYSKTEKEAYTTMFLEVAKHFEEGALKYGESNWQKGIPPKCYIDSAIRHYLKWLRGDRDEPHDRAFVWNLMCCIWEVDYHKE